MYTLCIFFLLPFSSIDRPHQPLAPSPPSTSQIPRRRTVFDILAASQRAFDGAKKTNNVLSPADFATRHAASRVRGVKVRHVHGVMR